MSSSTSNNTNAGANELSSTRGREEKDVNVQRSVVGNDSGLPDSYKRPPVWGPEHPEFGKDGGF